MSPAITAALILTAKLVIRKTRENPSLAKNPPKYTTAYIVQQSNCRWHCERLFTPCLFNLSPSYLSISNPSLSKPYVLSL
jgi:hypothetical protein